MRHTPRRPTLALIIATLAGPLALALPAQAEPPTQVESAAKPACEVAAVVSVSHAITAGRHTPIVAAESVDQTWTFTVAAAAAEEGSGQMLVGDAMLRIAVPAWVTILEHDGEVPEPSGYVAVELGDMRDGETLTTELRVRFAVPTPETSVEIHHVELGYTDTASGCIASVGESRHVFARVTPP